MENELFVAYIAQEIYSMVSFDGISFGKQIKKKRAVDLDITMRDLAEKLKLSPATISRCENGRPPDIETYGTLCEWLKVSADTFFIKAKRKTNGV